MHSRAQAGLEYLMTYGWALVLIVTVAGVLFFVMAPPSDSFVCTSSDPTKIIMKQYDFPYSPALVSQYTEGGIECGGDTRFCQAWGHYTAPPFFWGDPPGEMVLQNGTGGKIYITGASVDTEDITVPGCGSFSRLFSPAHVQGVPCVDYDISGVDCTNIGTTPIPVSKGGNINLKPRLTYIRIGHVSADCDLADAGYPLSSNTFNISYQNQFGYDKSVGITCYNTPSIG